MQSEPWPRDHLERRASFLRFCPQCAGYECCTELLQGLCDPGLAGSSHYDETFDAGDLGQCRANIRELHGGQSRLLPKDRPLPNHARRGDQARCFKTLCKAFAQSLELAYEAVKDRAALRDNIPALAGPPCE